MIYVTQGHEKSISIEVFLKSYLQLSKLEAERILFFVNKKSFEESLKALNWNYQLGEDFLEFGGKKLKCSFTTENINPTTDSLISALKKLELSKGVLFTLPTSKDQIFFEGKIVNGHTELFRKYFKKPDIAMVFTGPTMKSLLVTDHIPLKNVSSSITQKLIINKTIAAIDYLPNVNKIIFSGINPHSGENGLLGSEDKIITESIKLLQKQYSDKEFIGPLSGDTLHNHHEQEVLLVYMAHDQGLAPFKLANGLYGSNISLGLPFLRFSPDHGTAFDLYGKNKASHLGCLYSLRAALGNDG